MKSFLLIILCFLPLDHVLSAEFDDRVVGRWFGIDGLLTIEKGGAAAFTSQDGKSDEKFTSKYYTDANGSHHFKAFQNDKDVTSKLGISANGDCTYLLYNSEGYRRILDDKATLTPEGAASMLVSAINHFMTSGYLDGDANGIGEATDKIEVLEGRAPISAASNFKTILLSPNFLAVCEHNGIKIRAQVPGDLRQAEKDFKVIVESSAGVQVFDKSGKCIEGKGKDSVDSTRAMAAKAVLMGPYSDLIGTYRLDVDTYVKINKALDFSLWTNGTEEQVRAEVSDNISKIRVVLAEKRLGETTEAGLAKGETVGYLIKSIDNDGDAACMVMTYTISPGGLESHYYFRLFKKGGKLFLTKMLLGQEIVYPLVKVQK